MLSFHGRTGTGKNHVSSLIAESIYEKGMASQYVHLKVPQRDYPDKEKLQDYKVTDYLERFVQYERVFRW